MGGSHAQRDLVELMCIDAALRAQQHGIARSLITARLARRPASWINLQLSKRCAAA
jgi:hypothetical protein